MLKINVETYRITDAAFNYDGTMIVTGGINGEVRVYDVVTGQIIRRF